jgi:hypothetical protein
MNNINTIKDLMIEEVMLERSRKLQERFLQYINKRLDEVSEIIIEKKIPQYYSYNSIEEARLKLDIYIKLRKNVQDINKFCQLSEEYLIDIFSQLCDWCDENVNIEKIVKFIRFHTNEPNKEDDDDEDDCWD